jgi:chaperonin cofactor prefoldin
LSKLNDDRRCFRKIGENLVEKDLASVKKDLNVEILNIKQTLDVIYKTMVEQEKIINEYENKFNDILDRNLKNLEKKENEKITKPFSGEGVLV